MSTLRELKTRIGSVSSSEKITGAMKMISSAKVRKFEQALKRLVPFRSRIQSIMGHLLDADAVFSSPLIEPHTEVKKIGILVFGSDDGLCGAYNMNIFKHLLVTVNTLKSKYAGQQLEFELYPIGKKMRRAVEKLASKDILIAPQTSGIDSKMEGQIVNDFTKNLETKFSTGELDELHVVYMHFLSLSRQRVSDTQLFPILAEMLTDSADSKGGNKPYLFEPDANRIFNEILPMFVMSTMQEITIENRASEQAARIMAMQSANDNAKKLLESLQLEYNKLRQQSITTELLDILGGQVEQ
ncbi:MAG: ATP synthase F1 subunit gamma [Lachnospiraceae bacterium]|nr:ATP synthase F1 subunit gamma [Lachnospiraceae bacterium]